MKSTHVLQRIFLLLYGLLAYLAFLATISYAAGFVGNFLVPKAIDAIPRVPLGVALLVDGGLLAVFALQHSAMARPRFKAWLTRRVNPAAERSTYVLASSAALGALFWLWEPIGGVIWQVDSHVGRALLAGGCAFGWLLVLTATFLINHFDLFGLRQVWLNFRRRQYTPLTFNTPGPYKVIRHPLYFGFLCAFWCTPTMSAAHLFFALMTTAYILVAIQLEERDLRHAHPEYTEYIRRTPMLVPGLGRNAGGTAAAPTTRGHAGTQEPPHQDLNSSNHVRPLRTLLSPPNR